MKPLKRRHFLKLSGSAIATLSLASLFPALRLFRSAFGAEEASGFFVHINTNGGMDSTLGLDPHLPIAGVSETEFFLEYRPEDILKAAELRLGPAAAALVPYAPDLAVVNGVMMRRDAGHPALNAYMSSGVVNGSPFVSASLATSLGMGPFGIVVGDASSVPQSPVILSTTGSLKSMVLPGGADPVEILRLLLTSRADKSELQRAEQAILDGRPAAMKLVDVLKAASSNPMSLTETQVVAAALASGAAMQAELTVGANVSLDTHANHPVNHLNAQTKVWQEVAEIFKTFKAVAYRDKSLFDHTTFMVTSEFSRTPNIDASRGKDHNPFTNSVLLAGRGVSGGKVFGESRYIRASESTLGRPLLIGAPIDYRTGRATDSPDSGEFIFPENVVRAIALLFGDPAAFTSVPKSVLPVPGLVKPS